MKNRWIYAFAIIIIAAAALFLIKENFKRVDGEDNFTNSLEKDEIELLKGNIILNNQINGKIIEVEAEDIYGNKIALNKLRTTKPKLVFFTLN